MSRFFPWFSNDSAAGSRKTAARRGRPAFETLEDRLVPSSAPLDLTSVGAQGTIGAALFQQGSTQPSGSGVIDSFVRIHGLGGAAQEQGYNTSARPLQFNENSSPTFTRSLQLSQVPLSNVNGVNYRVFLLDINQKASAPLVSLDQLQIFVGGSGNLTGYNQTTRTLAGLNAVYDMSATGDNWVELNARLSHGSGSSDMYLYVPDALFVGTAGNPFIYVFSRFGDHFGTNGGYEEWAVSRGTGPAPSALSGFSFDTSSSTPGVPLAGVTVELTGVDFNGNQVTLFAVTDTNGFFYFDSLAAGTYTLTEIPPTNFVGGTDVAGNLGGSLGNNQISGINLGAGVNGTGYDFTNFLFSNPGSGSS
jgi:hypothetical protein